MGGFCSYIFTESGTLFDRNNYNNMFIPNAPDYCIYRMFQKWKCQTTRKKHL